jgi:hypothetical protein
MKVVVIHFHPLDSNVEIVVRGKGVNKRLRKKTGAAKYTGFGGEGQRKGGGGGKVEDVRRGKPEEAIPNL